MADVGMVEFDANINPEKFEVRSLPGSTALGVLTDIWPHVALQVLGADMQIVNVALDAGEVRPLRG